MKSSSFLIGWIFVAGGTWGCRATSGDPGEVLEQSRATRPAWVSELLVPPSLQHDQLQWVNEKIQVYDLTLGLKQAHAAALHEARLETWALIQTYWQEQGLIAILTSEERQNLGLQLRQVLERQMDEQLVQDIYFERRAEGDRRDESRESFVIYVHVMMPKAKIVQVFADLRQAFQASQTPALRSLAQMKRAFPLQL